MIAKYCISWVCVIGLISLALGELSLDDASSDRNKALANAISGIYEPPLSRNYSTSMCVSDFILNQNLLTEGLLLNKYRSFNETARCPSLAMLKVEYGSTEEGSTNKDTFTLFSPTDFCAQDVFSAETKTELSGKGVTHYRLLSMDTKNGAFALSTHLNGTSHLHCTSKTIFKHVRIISLQQPIIALLRMVFRDMGVSETYFDHVLDTGRHQEESILNRNVLSEVAWMVSSAVHPLDKAFALILEEDNEIMERSISSFTSQVRNSCFYIGGSVQIEKIVCTVTNAVRALAPLVYRVAVRENAITNDTFYPSYSSCANGIDSLQFIELNTSRPESRLYNLRINSNNVDCGAVRLKRFVNFKNPSNYTMHIFNATVSQLFRTYNTSLADESERTSTLGEIFPEAQKEAELIHMKSSVLAASLDNHTCPDALPSSPIVFIFVDVPPIARFNNISSRLQHGLLVEPLKETRCPFSVVQS